MIKRIIINYNDKEVPAILLAHFEVVDDSPILKKGLFTKIKDFFKPTKRKYYLVFIPWKHSLKELALVPLENVIKTDELAGEDVISVEEYISPYTDEEPWYAECKIWNFVGYKFIYENKSFIINCFMQDYKAPQQILYMHQPELLKEEFNEE